MNTDTLNVTNTSNRLNKPPPPSTIPDELIDKDCQETEMAPEKSQNKSDPKREKIYLQFIEISTETYMLDIYQLKIFLEKTHRRART